MPNVSSQWSAVLLSLIFVGCGGGQTAAPSAAPPEPAPATSASETPAGPPAKSPAPPASAAAPAAPPPSGEKPSRSPVDTVTGAKVAYVINYPNSAPTEADQKKCGGVAEDAKAACLKKERSNFFADVVRFKKDAQDKVWFYTYHRTGKTLTVLHKTPVELVNDGDAALKVQILGDDKAVRVLFPKSKSFAIRVPNDYSIEIEEPRLGHLLYDAKLDVVGN